MYLLVALVMWQAGASVCQAAAIQEIVAMQRVAAAGGDTRDITLPDNWNRQGLSGAYVYSAAFSVSAHRVDEPWALFIPRAGNRLRVEINGQRIDKFGAEEAPTDRSQQPHYFTFSPSPGQNLLRITVQGERARYAGLSAVQIGPASEVRPAFEWRERAQVWGAFAIIAVSMLFASTALPLAIRTGDRAVIIFLVTCLLCALRTSYVVVSHPPMDYRLWSMLIDGSYVAYLVGLCFFCVELLKLHQHWTRYATIMMIVAAAILLPLYGWWRMSGARQVLLACMLAYGALIYGLMLRQWLYTRSRESAALSMAGGVALGLASYDHLLVFYTQGGYGAFTLGRYSLVPFLLTMGYLIAERLFNQGHLEDSLRQRVAAELRERTAELERHFDLHQQLAAAKAHQAERQKLLQDLHDGMGLQLHGLLGMVQGAPLERSELTREVRTAIEQMRMLIETADGFDGDVSILLGDLRYRLEQRLRRYNIDLKWSVALACPQRTMHPEHALALQRLVFEWATNTLKHSGATEAALCASDDATAEGGLFIQYEDNGRGFESAATSQGMGMRSIQRRVRELDARLNLMAQPQQGVRYQLWIPMSIFQDQRPDNDVIPRTG
jgi:signal transduction histidine kinase